MRGAALSNSTLSKQHSRFLLTRLMRGAAGHSQDSVCYREFLLTRLMRGAAEISEETGESMEFLLTRLMRGAACYKTVGTDWLSISTHAPHARRGKDGWRIGFSEQHFYSRASCEARRPKSRNGSKQYQISTHAPHARRGPIFKKPRYDDLISTHAPHARRGAAGYDYDAVQADFYSRASCEARP